MCANVVFGHKKKKRQHSRNWQHEKERRRKRWNRKLYQTTAATTTTTTTKIQNHLTKEEKIERQNHNESKGDNIHKNRNILTSAEPDERIQYGVRARTRTHAREYHKERRREEREKTGVTNTKHDA